MFGGGSSSAPTCPTASNDGYDGPASPITGSLTFQHIMLIVSGTCSILTLTISLWLIFKHLRRYTHPYQQRQIIRIVFTPWVFTVFSLLCVASYPAAQYLNPIRDLYEAFSIVGLFFLFVDYVTPMANDVSTRLAFFSHWPPRPAKQPRYRRKHVTLFAFLFVQIIVAIAVDASEGAGTYCATSMSIHFAHVWTLILKNASLAFAIISIVQFYRAVKKNPNIRNSFLSHKPMLKLVSFKLIVLINAIQGLIFSVLTGHNVLTGSTTITANDLSYGLPAMLVCIEQVFFACFFHYTFSSGPYREDYHLQDPDSVENGHAGSGTMPVHRMSMLRAAADAINPMDYVKGVVDCFTLFSHKPASHPPRVLDAQDTAYMGGYGGQPRGRPGRFEQPSESSSDDELKPMNDAHLHAPGNNAYPPEGYSAARTPSPSPSRYGDLPPRY